MLLKFSEQAGIPLLEMNNSELDFFNHVNDRDEHILTLNDVPRCPRFGLVKLNAPIPNA